MANIDKEFKGQVNTAWGLTIQTTNKVPEVAKRIFRTKSDALAYVQDINDTAIEGLILTVVEDGANNGAYFVKSIKTSENENGGELVKLSDSNIDTSLYKIAEGSVEDIPEPLENKIYLVKDSATGDSANIYTEYIYVKQDQGYVWEKLGEYKATIELGDYYKKSETYSSTEVDSKINDVKNNYLLKESNEPQTISVTINDSLNEGCYDKSLLSINGTGLTCAFSAVNAPGNDPIGGAIEITNSENCIDIKSDRRIRIVPTNIFSVETDDTYSGEKHYLTFNELGNLKIDGTLVSLEGHNHDDLYYTETEVNNLLKDKLSTTTDGEISVNEIVHLGGVFDEEAKDSLRLIHSDDTERRIELTSTGINFEVNYDYTDGNEDHQSVVTTVTINDTLRVGGTPVSLEGHTHEGLDKISQLESTIEAMQKTIESLQEQIEGLTTGQGIVTPQNIGRYAVTEIRTDNKPEDMEIIHNDDYSGIVSITLKGISNIAFDEAIQINGENTAQF